MTEKTNPLSQPIRNRQSGADAADAITEPTTAAKLPKKASPAGAARNDAGAASTEAPGCLQRISMSIFFDGTGNNLDADLGTGEHSNVARLFRAHFENDETAQTYKRYVPGIGTYFNDVGDPGGTKTGRGMGAYGQKRLDWAFKELALVLQKAEARANNPNNKIVDVRVAVFGFSRGAALARAFCRDLQKSAIGKKAAFKVRAGAFGTSGITLEGTYPIEVYFLGIFDTVASVGIPLSGNNAVIKRRDGIGWRDLAYPELSYGAAERDLKNLAFGEPGADPAPGPADGHGSWADGLDIADVVTQCVHMAAGHEMRNSFPLDSALIDSRYPSGTTEMVYPGVHSDVGGGYQEGEGGKSALLSRIPLRAMLEKAVSAKVPIRSLTQLDTETRKKDFAMDDEGASAFNTLANLWTKYMSSVVGGDKPLGAVVLNHMQVYWRYRLSVAVRRTDPTHAGRPGRGGRARQYTPEQQTIIANEKGFSQHRAELQKDVDARQAAYGAAAARRSDAEDALNAAKSSPGYDNQVPFWQGQVQQATRDESQRYDEWRSAQAKLTTAADDSDLIKNTDSYDTWLLEDAQLLSKWHKEDPKARMRPHYRAIVEAYEEVVTNRRLMEETSDTYVFFNHYVHDSLSGFAFDNTRTSDPRVIYIGGDVKYRYAMNTSPRARDMAVA